MAVIPRTILYFGSFNPIHNGHMAVARWLLDNGMGGEVWFVVSPQNPLKEESTLIGEQDRLEMVDIAIKESGYHDRMKACDVEFGMLRPSYTIDTMRELDRLWPDKKFAILVGADIIDNLGRWKESDTLLSSYPVIVYPRRGYEPVLPKGRVTMLWDAPTWEFSSTQVREAIGSGNTVSGMIGAGVYKYIKERGLWG